MTELQYAGLNDLYLTSSVPFCIVSEAGQEAYTFPKEFSGIYRQSFYLALIADLKRSLYPDGVLEWYINEYQFSAITDLCDGHYLVTAPVSSGIFKPDKHSCLEYIHANKLSFFLNYIQDIPSRPNFSLSRAVMLGKQLYSGKNIQGRVSIKYFLSQEIVPLKHTDEDSSRKLLDFRPQAGFCSAFHIQHLQSCIKKGDFPAFSMAYHRPVPGLFGAISHTSVRQARYSCILLLYIIATAAVDGGMPYEYSFDLFSYYCLKMDHLTDISEMEKLKMIAADDYCKKVSKCRLEKQYHPSTRAAIKYIHRHIYQKIQIQDISDYVHLNRSTLSAYFKQDTGQTIMEFVNATKLEEAKYLLTDTQTSCQQIIELLGFCSQSYFIQKFRSHFGITPQQYLDGNH